jgi:hypothetical protein
MKSIAYVVFTHPPSLSGLTPVPQTKDTSIQNKNYFTMQPPVITPHLRDSVNLLVTKSREKATCHPPSNTEMGAILDCYANQIMKWSQHLSPAQLSRKYSIEEVMALACLRGRYRDHASVRYTSEALRRCGFVTKRDWTVAGRNKRYWMKESP